jgi:hypothetical protein
MSPSYVLTAQPGQVAGTAKRDKPAVEAHRPKRPARLRSPRKPLSRTPDRRIRAGQQPSKQDLIPRDPTAPWLTCSSTNRNPVTASPTRCPAAAAPETDSGSSALSCRPACQRRSRTVSGLTIEQQLLIRRRRVVLRARGSRRGHLQWPHRGRLKWPHLASVFVLVDVA